MRCPCCPLLYQERANLPRNPRVLRAGLLPVESLVQKPICLRDELIRAADMLIPHLLKYQLQILCLLPKSPQLLVLQRVGPGHLIDQELTV